jgi:hypothetical protein
MSSHWLTLARPLSTSSRTPSRRAARRGDELRRVHTRLKQSQIERLRRIHRDVGIPPAEQIRRAVDLWLRGHGTPRSK